MPLETQSFEFNQTIQATPEQVFYAFTNADALKGWLCDVATLSPKNGGRIYLAWNSGFYTVGEFTLFEKDRALIFTWFGRSEPAPTQVEVSLTPENDQTHVKVTQHGLGYGENWESMIQEVKEGWPSSLENLCSVLENGPDLRIVLRPMLGITVGDFDANSAAQLGIPVTEGIRLDGVLEEMGAYAAGLRKDDVIVGLAGQKISDWPSLSNALSGRRAGDTVAVEYYRGPQKHTGSMVLSRRPVPEMMADVPALAKAIQDRFAGLQPQLDALLEGVSEADASSKPAPDAWSVKEVLAHLIHGERDGQAVVCDTLGGQTRWSDDYAGNLAMRTNATLNAFPTLADLRKELMALQAETVALYENIPAEFPQQRKGAWWGLCYFAAEPPYHELGHFDQIKEALAAARR